MRPLGGQGFGVLDGEQTFGPRPVVTPPQSYAFLQPFAPQLSTQGQAFPGRTAEAPRAVQWQPEPLPQAGAPAHATELQGTQPRPPDMQPPAEPPLAPVGLLQDWQLTSDSQAQQRYGLQQSQQDQPFLRQKSFEDRSEVMQAQEDVRKAAAQVAELGSKLTSQEERVKQSLVQLQPQHALVLQTAAEVARLGTQLREKQDEVRSAASRLQPQQEGLLQAQASVEQAAHQVYSLGMDLKAQQTAVRDAVARLVASEEEIKLGDNARVKDAKNQIEQATQQMQNALGRISELETKQQDIADSNRAIQVKLEQQQHEKDDLLRANHEKQRILQDQLARQQEHDQQIAARDSAYKERLQLAMRSLETTEAKRQMLQEQLMQQTRQDQAYKERLQDSEQQLQNAAKKNSLLSEQYVQTEKQFAQKEKELQDRLQIAEERLRAREGTQSKLILAQVTAQQKAAAEAEKRLNATNSILQAQLAQLRSEEARSASLQLANSQLLKQRSSDQQYLDSSQRLLRGGEARLKQAALQLQGAKTQASALETLLARQRNATAVAEAKAADEERSLNASLDKSRLLQAEVLDLQAKSRRLTVLPWAELLDRCRDVCFTVAHQVACCGGPTDTVAQRPQGCDLAARVAEGRVPVPTLCSNNMGVASG